MIEIQIIVARYKGMCGGVRSAVDIAEENAVKGNSGNGKEVYTLGHLVHNPHVTEYFKEKGVKAVSSLDEIKDGTVIIRAHGVPDKTKEDAKKKGLKVVDATCNLVLRLKDAAEDLQRKGYQVVVYGEKEHPEIIGITGNIKNPIVINSIEEAMALGRYDRIGFAAQTTKMPEKYNEIRDELANHCRHLEAVYTICDATQKRQEAARDIAEKVGVMMVIGDPSSSNSKNLLKVCSAVNENTIMIGCSNDLKPNYFKGTSSVGVTASASTPDWVIDEVVETLKRM